MHSLEEENLILKNRLEKKARVIKRQQETIQDYESKFILLSSKIDELTKRLYTNTPVMMNESYHNKKNDYSQAAALPNDLLRTRGRSNKSVTHPYEIPTKKKEFAYVESSRCKHKRAKMLGETCTCCEKFYKDELQQITSKERIQMNSRHRSKYRRSKTPPGFWDVEFPSDDE